MKSTKNFRFLFFSIVIGLLLIITACGNNDDSTTETKNENKESTETAEVTLDSAMGEVTIPADIKRVMAPFHEDALLALGVTPVAKWAIGETVQEYLEKDLKDVPSIEWNLPLEQVLSHEPDLIILENNMDGYEGKYEEYNKIATTYVMTEETQTDWHKQIETFGKILGKEEAAKKALSDYETKVTEAKDQLKEAIGDQTVAAIWAVGNQFFLFEHNRHSADVVYNELGLNQPALVKELGDAQNAQWNPISVEKLSELDADHVFLLALEGEQGIETLENSAVWQSTPAAQNGNVHILNDASNWTNKGLLASEKTIDDIVKTLIK
ncbi:iron-hydroxamate ABC transporter substrate-binding protein [Niallia endozanthoxylica]|uniref:Iron-hydroxamate ABC transporter substrate-binding protein n=1 Tax=Niallia endozanthoxylica TaxID=2036016 RepID=A0A5J5I1M2_9BACI|nr:iron-hydroxamate ABC transporter substrate-binding protein [Niallia endozanthoxylica]KAA9028440.1 iron-hydroxamate ABC transporter substrate-binding protein [Niallia endozanthoxylica]